jgi:membrane dipeptidase
MRTRLLLAAVTIMFAGAQSKNEPRTISDAEVMRVHRSALLIDTHNDVPSRTVEGFDIGSRTGTGHTDIARLKEGGVGAQFFAVYVAASYVTGSHSANRTLQMIDTVRHDIIGRYPNDFVLATTANGIEEAHRQGKIAALMGIEGGHAIEDNVRLLRDFYALGIRYMTLTHSNTNNWADSSGDVNDPNIKHHNGLTAFGKDIILEMNRLGMMVDISHVADKTFWDALEVSKAPIFASHSSCRALTNHARNMTDDMIVALAKKGGVVQVNFYCGFISEKFRDNDTADTKALDARLAQETAGKNLSEPDRQILSEKLRKEMRLSRATLADVVDHIDHIRKIAGIDAIGIGADFDGVSCTPVGLDDVSKYPNLTRALLEKGYSAEDIRKIYGGNFLRVMRAVEAQAGK